MTFNHFVFVVVVVVFVFLCYFNCLNQQHTSLNSGCTRTRIFYRVMNVYQMNF